MNVDDTRAAEYYDDFSRRYDMERGRGYHAFVDGLEFQVIKPFARDACVLEAGCGTGLLLERVSRIARSAKGIDVSLGMLEKATSRGLDVSFGSITDIPFQDGAFDLAYSCKVLPHVPEVGKALAEMARVTRPGGHIIAEFYNPWSLRYIAKRIAGPGKIAETKTEADMYTRWDTPFSISKVLPPRVRPIRYEGVRIVTPGAFVHEFPIAGTLLKKAERFASHSPLRVFGGFLLIILERL